MSGVMWNWPVVWPLMWQSRHVTPRLGWAGFTVVGGVEFFLRERCQQQAQPIELHGRQDVLEEPIIVVDRNDLAARNVSQLRTSLQIDGRRELGEKGFGQVEFDVVSLQAGEHLDLHLRKDLAA